MLAAMIACQIGSGQVNGQHGIYAKARAGANDDVEVQQFDLGYQYKIAKGLYVYGAHTKVQGSRSLNSILGYADGTLVAGSLTNTIFIDSGGDLDGISGRLYESSTWSIGATKYIQTGSKIYISGSIGMTWSQVVEMDVVGYRIVENGQVDITDMHPVFGEYSGFGAAVDLQASYQINRNLHLTIGAGYLTQASLVSGGIGLTFFIHKKSEK